MRRDEQGVPLTFQGFIGWEANGMCNYENNSDLSEVGNAMNIIEVKIIIEKIMWFTVKTNVSN